MNNNTTAGEADTTETTLYTSPEAEAEAKTTAEQVTSETVDATGDTTDTTTTATDTGTVLGGTEITSTVVLEKDYSATNSIFTIASGDTFSATGAKVKVDLSGNQITNNDATSAFLRAKSSDVSLTFAGQVAEGDIILDNLSSLSLVLSNSSYYMGAINGTNSAQAVSLSIDGTSQLILAGDSYVDALTNTDETNMNIFSNGHKLYVAGAEVTINGSKVPAVPEVVVEKPAEPEEGQATTSETTSKPAATTTGTGDNSTAILVAIIAVIVIIAGLLAVLIHNRRKNSRSASPAEPMTPPAAPEAGRPDFSAFDDGPATQPTPAAPAQPATPPETQNPVPPVTPTNPNPGV